MNKNSKTILAVIVIVLVIAGIVWYGHSSSGTSMTQNDQSVPSASNGSSTPSAPVSEITKVSNQISEYQNAELGFSVKYPTAWEKDESASGVTFVMPIDKSQVSTVAKLQGDITVTSGNCAFPPVTTVKDRGTLVVGSDTLNMISISNNVQGREYFTRLYSLQHGPICYFFDFSSIALSTSDGKLTGSNVTQAQNNNKAIMNTSDAAFTGMVKSFAFVTGPQGIDETKAPTVK
jgi:hypothetical protein